MSYFKPLPAGSSPGTRGSVSTAGVTVCQAREVAVADVPQLGPKYVDVPTRLRAAGGRLVDQLSLGFLMAIVFCPFCFTSFVVTSVFLDQCVPQRTPCGCLTRVRRWRERWAGRHPARVLGLRELGGEVPMARHKPQPFYPSFPSHEEQSLSRAWRQTCKRVQTKRQTCFFFSNPSENLFVVADFPHWFSSPLSFPTADASCLAWVSGVGHRKSSCCSCVETPSIRRWLVGAYSYIAHLMRVHFAPVFAN